MNECSVSQSKKPKRAANETVCLNFDDNVLTSNCASVDSISQCTDPVLDQQTHLLQFDNNAHGTIHEQNWAKANMRKFHNSMK